MSEKLFVIMEVEKIKTMAESFCGEMITKYAPKDNVRSCEIDGIGLEWFYLKPSRIIPASRLRYGKPNQLEDYFEPSLGGFAFAKHNLGATKLILDPEPEEKDEWDEWKRSIPSVEKTAEGHCHKAKINEILDWLYRMPRSKE